MKITIDSREQHRINSATQFFKQKGDTVTISKETTGDYIFNDQVVMEFKTWSDFMSSITDHRLFNETLTQMENYEIHFLVIHGTNRDYQEAYQHNGLEDKHINGAIARLLTYTKIIWSTKTLDECFELMRTTAEKCLDDKTICKNFGTKSVNPAFNVLAFCIPDINAERAKNIVNFLNLHTIKDVTKLTQEDLMKVPGIGKVLSQRIIKSIGE